MNEETLLKMVEDSMSLISSKNRNTTAEKYAYNVLNKALEFIKNNAKYTGTIKYFHRGLSCVDELRIVFGDECLYIYAIMQVYKHMYLYDYDRNNDDYMAAEFYKKIAEKISNEKEF